MRLATASGPVPSSRLIRPRRTAAVARGSADLASPINPRQGLSFSTASVRSGSRTQATIRSALRPFSPFPLLDAAPQTGPLFRKRTPVAGYPARIRNLLRWRMFLPRIGPTAAAFEQLVGAEVKRPGRARTGGCACACALRRRSRSRPPVRSAARPAHPLLSADPRLARCALLPAAFR